MVKRYVITSAQASYWKRESDKGVEIIRRGPVATLHQELWNGLNKYCQVNDAELIVLPLPGKDIRENVFHESVLDVCNPKEDVRRLNSNVAISDIKVAPQNVDPVTGRTRFAQHDRTLIFPHTKQRFKAIPSSNSKLPKLLITTGVITRPNYYERSSRGDVAKRDHIYGAVVVEVIDNIYYNVRHIRAQKNGRFIDLGVVYNGNCRPLRATTDSLILGDLHIGDLSTDAYSACKEQIRHFRPKNLIIHDLFNGHSINPHVRNRSMERIRNWQLGKLSLREEISDVSGILKELSSIVGRNNKVYIVRSNHDEFLDRYLNRGDWVKEPWNADIAMQLGAAMAKGENPLEYAIRELHGLPDNVIFLKLTDDLKKWGYQLASHGHRGNSGSRVTSATSRETAHGGRSITGHTHTPEILRDTYIVGTNTYLDLPYTYGSANSWMHTNVVIYDGGLVQMVPIIKDKWKAKEEK